MKAMKKTGAAPVTILSIVMLGVIGAVLVWKLAPMLGKSVTESFEMPLPTYWSIPHNTKVYIDGEMTSVIGTDTCNTGFGEGYRCWRFSLTPGDTQTIVYGNGDREQLTTRARDARRVYLQRPDGTTVQVSEAHRS